MGAKSAFFGYPLLREETRIKRGNTAIPRQLPWPNVCAQPSKDQAKPLTQSHQEWQGSFSRKERSLRTGCLAHCAVIPALESAVQKHSAWFVHGSIPLHRMSKKCRRTEMKSLANVCCNMVRGRSSHGSPYVVQPLFATYQAHRPDPPSKGN